MGKQTMVSILVAAGLLMALAGCTAAVSDSGPGPSPGRGYRWGQGQPRLLVIEGTGIQYAADCSEDIYLCDSIWYRFSGGAWFSTRSVGGNWVAVNAPPPAFRKIPPGHAKFHKVEGQDSDRPGKGPPSDRDHGQGKGPKWK